MPAHLGDGGSASNAAFKPSVPVASGQTLIASNRGPVEFYRAADGRLATRRGAGAWSRRWRRLRVMYR